MLRALTYGELNLGDLCTADVEDRAVSRGFSCSNFGKLLDISIAGGE